MKEKSTPGTAAFHIELEIEKLIALAEEQNFDLLVYLLSCAKMEAEDVVQKHS